MRRDVIKLESAKMLWLYPMGTAREAVEAELRATRLAMDVGLEVPFVHGIQEHEGRLGMVMDEVIGPDYLEWMLRTPNAWEKLSRFFAYEHHEMHLHRIPELPSLKLRMEGMVRRSGLEDAVMSRVLDVLERLPEGDAVCHMNYFPSNVVVSLDGPKVLDWSMASRGFYMGDVARTCLLLELAAMRPESYGLSVDQVNMLMKLSAGYRFESIKICGKGEEDIREWMGPVAAARMAEGVAGEKEALLRIVKESLD